MPSPRWDWRSSGAGRRSATSFPVLSLGTMSRTVAVVQARMLSHRLPGKAMADLGGKPVIQHVLERASAAEEVDEAVLATTWDESDDVLAGWCRDNGYRAFPGSPTDLLHRIRVAAEWANAEIVVRLAGDCPCLEPGVISRVVRALKAEPCDYASNVINRTYPDGLDTEVLWMDTLARLDRLDRRTERNNDPLQLLEKRPDLFVGVSVE